LPFIPLPLVEKIPSPTPQAYPEPPDRLNNIKKGGRYETNSKAYGKAAISDCRRFNFNVRAYL
jgi:hypothetical protein